MPTPPIQPSCRPYTRSAHRRATAAPPLPPGALEAIFPVYTPPRRTPRPRDHEPHWHREEWLEDLRACAKDDELSVSDFPADADPTIIGIGEPTHPIHRANTSHVERREGGYTAIYSREGEVEHRAEREEELKKRREERARRARRRGGVGAARRRWVWKHGKPGGKGKGVSGPDWRRGKDGRFLARVALGL